jgi:hypothetical protein
VQRRAVRGGLVTGGRHQVEVEHTRRRGHVAEARADNLGR